MSSEHGTTPSNIGWHVYIHNNLLTSEDKGEGVMTSILGVLGLQWVQKGQWPEYVVV